MNFQLRKIHIPDSNAADGANIATPMYTICTNQWTKCLYAICTTCPYLDFLLYSLHNFIQSWLLCCWFYSTK